METVKEVAKREIFEKVEEIMVHYCEGCFLHKQLKRELGRRVAHRFCISECTVGEMLKGYGKRLT